MGMEDFEKSGKCKDCGNEKIYGVIFRGVMGDTKKGWSCKDCDGKPFHITLTFNQD